MDDRRTITRFSPYCSESPFLALLSVVSFFLVGCESVPQAQIDEANSLGNGIWRAELNLSDDPNFSISRGVGANTDLGVQLDYLNTDVYSGYAKYSFRNQQQGWSTAALAGGFVGEENSSKGYFLGPVASYKAGRSLVSIRARYNRLTRRGQEEGLLTDFDFPSDEVAQLDVSIRGYFAQDKLSLKFGYGCQYLLGDNDLSESQKEVYDRANCAPSIGFTLYTK